MKQKDMVLAPQKYCYIAYKSTRSYDIVPGSLCAIRLNIGRVEHNGDEEGRSKRPMMDGNKIVILMDENIFKNFASET